MFCKACGAKMEDSHLVCQMCGTKKGAGKAFCEHCGTVRQVGVSFCQECGNKFVDDENAAPVQRIIHSICLQRSSAAAVEHRL